MIDTIKIGTLSWFHLHQPSDEDFQFISKEFHFHPLDIEDCKSKLNQRPKVDIYDDYYFLILHFPVFDKSMKLLKTREVKIFWGQDYVITVGSGHWVINEMFNEGKKQEKAGEEFEVGTSDALLYSILIRLLKANTNIMQKIGQDIDVSSKQLFDKKAVKTIEGISITRKNLILLNTIFKPQLPIFAQFESGRIEGFADKMEDYWSNVLDYIKNMWDRTEDYEELIEGLAKTFDSLQANRTNEIMKILTLVSSILLPLTFLTGLYGMNVNLPLQDDPRSFWIVVGAMVAIAVFMTWFFKRKNWM